MPECRLCRYPIEESWTFPGDGRVYDVCHHCGLVQVKESLLPSPEDARARYLLHADDAGSDGHRRFLSQAVVPSLPFLRPDYTILDFGCGPVPVLASILSQQGFDCENFDPNFDFFIPENKQYEHVFCLETAEHFARPFADWNILNQRVKPGGMLTLMTERYIDQRQFSGWYYKRDKTHVAFYHEKTIQFLSDIFRFDILFDDGIRVTVFRKKDKT
jgi:hypothetical protein